MTSDPHPRDPFQPVAPNDDTTWVPAAPPAAPVPATPVRTGSGGKGAGLLVNVLLGVALVVAVGGVAFAAGRATAPVATAAAGNGNGRFGNGGFVGGPNASGAPAGNGGFLGGPGGTGGAVSIQGTVTAVSADSITLQLANGQSVTIPLDAQTTYHTRSSATAANVTSGSTVIVQLEGGRGLLTGNGNGNGGATASGQPTRTLPPAGSVTLVPAGS